MFDGKGMADEPFKDGLPSEHWNLPDIQDRPVPLRQKLPVPALTPGQEEPLLQTQGSDGGFHTGYDQAGTYAGTKENAETTSIVMIVLNSITPPQPPFWIIYAAAGTATVGAAIILLVLFREHRRKTLSQPALSQKEDSSTAQIPHNQP